MQRCPFMMDHMADITRRERRTMNMIVAFALAVIVATITWLAFTRYL
jgi:hypothetical protein